jgi:hypothetical protein
LMRRRALDRPLTRDEVVQTSAASRRRWTRLPPMLPTSPISQRMFASDRLALFCMRAHRRTVGRCATHSCYRGASSRQRRASTPDGATTRANALTPGYSWSMPPRVRSTLLFVAQRWPRSAMPASLHACVLWVGSSAARHAAVQELCHTEGRRRRAVARRPPSETPGGHASPQICHLDREKYANWRNPRAALWSISCCALRPRRAARRRARRCPLGRCGSARRAGRGP